MLVLKYKSLTNISTYYIYVRYFPYFNETFSSYKLIVVELRIKGAHKFRQLINSFLQLSLYHFGNLNSKYLQCKNIYNLFIIEQM